MGGAPDTPVLEGGDRPTRDGPSGVQCREESGKGALGLGQGSGGSGGGGPREGKDEGVLRPDGAKRHLVPGGVVGRTGRGGPRVTRGMRRAWGPGPSAEGAVPAEAA